MIEISSLITNTGMLSFSDAIHAGVSKNQFYRFVKKNRFERIGNGIYMSPDAWKDDLYVLHRRCPQAVFSHEEALYYHDLTDREPLHHVITIYTGYNTKRLTTSGCKVHTVKKELMKIGKVLVLDSNRNPIPIYDLERTICDVVRSRRQVEAQDLNAALKNYVTRRDKDLNRLMEYAEAFHVEKLIRSYMEVLL